MRRASILKLCICPLLMCLPVAARKPQPDYTQPYLLLEVPIRKLKKEFNRAGSHGCRVLDMVPLCLLVGPKWRDLAAERKKLRQELGRERVHTIKVRIRQKVKIGRAILPPGTCELVLLKRVATQGALYFFRAPRVYVKRAVAGVVVPPELQEGGKENVRKFVAAAAVGLQPYKGGSNTPELVFAAGGEKRQIDEIRTKSLRMVVRKREHPSQDLTTPLPPSLL